VRVLRLVALILAIAAALSPALLPRAISGWDGAATGVRIPLIRAMSSPSVPALPLTAMKTDLASTLSLARYRSPDRFPLTKDARYTASLDAVNADSEVVAARAEVSRFETAALAHEGSLDSRRFVGSSLVMLALVAVGIFTVKTYRRGHRFLGGALLVCAVASVPLAIPQMSNERASVPVFSMVNVFQPRTHSLVLTDVPELPKAPDGEVWSHAAVDEARPFAASFLTEILANEQGASKQMADDDAVAKRQLVMSRALLSVGTLTVLAIGSYRRLSRWHPGFRRHFPTLWPKSPPHDLTTANASSRNEWL
jgi:hypothetical protein